MSTHPDDSIFDMRLDDFLHPKGMGIGYAVLIGVKQYRHVREVPGAINDVGLWRERLIRGKWKKNNIKVITDKAASKVKVISAVRWLVSERYPNDSLLLHFSGHGTWIRSELGWECGWCCTEFDQNGASAQGVISGTELQNQLALKHPDSKLIVFSDSCFSGGMMKPPRKRLPAKLPVEVRNVLRQASPAVRASSKAACLTMRDGQVEISDTKPSNGYHIPLAGRLEVLTDPLVRMLYLDVMYPIVERPHQGKRRFSLKEPDPWMVAIAYIMVEGIIQGLAWEFVKSMVKAALIKLRRHDLAPNRVRGKKKPRSKRQFIWNEYGTDEDKMYELFNELQKAYSKRKNKSGDLLGKRKKTAGPKVRDWS